MQNLLDFSTTESLISQEKKAIQTYFIPDFRYRVVYFMPICFKLLTRILRQRWPNIVILGEKLEIRKNLGIFKQNLGMETCFYHWNTHFDEIRGNLVTFLFCRAQTNASKGPLVKKLWNRITNESSHDTYINNKHD